jgi:hypothetical protein
MSAREDLLQAMLRECDLCVHLHGRIPPGGMEFRFTPGQRSTAELLRYLSFVGLAAAASASEGSWAPYDALAKEAEGLAPGDFPAAMERQKRGLRELFGRLTDRDLEERTFEQPWGERMPLGRAIWTLGAACLTAYRMQLFLQAKAAGNLSLSTSNCWGGRDRPPEPVRG